MVDILNKLHVLLKPMDANKCKRGHGDKVYKAAPLTLGHHRWRQLITRHGKKWTVASVGMWR